MVISFDLDDTLIPGRYLFDTQPQRLWHKVFRLERLRAGTVPLMRILQSKGHRIFIYTTSLRPRSRVRWMFRLYGIRVEKVINQAVHEEVLGQRAGHHSKYPPAFHIDVHVDDAHGVALEGERHHFKTILVPGAAPHWTDFVLRKIAHLQEAE